LSYISRAADLGHEAASTVVKRLYDAPSAAFPKKLDLEACLKRGIRAGSAIAEQDFCSAWSTRTEEICNIRQGEWLARHYLDKDAVERQFWDSSGKILPEYIVAEQHGGADDSRSLGVPQATLLNYLAVMGKSHKLKYLFKESALAVSLINIQDSDGQSPVIAACKYGHFEVFKILLKHEASVTLDHWAHESCLHWVSSFIRRANRVGCVGTWCPRR
jgi:hypothetical protein